MNWPYLLNSFEGRIGRQTFWISFTAVVIIEIMAHLLAFRIEGERLSSIVNLAFAYPEFAIFAKRGHDRNMPIWAPGAFFAIGVLMDFLVIFGLIRENEEPGALTLVILVLWSVFMFALLLDLGFRKGTRGPNRYGPDPLAGHA